jgi:hypothetical protein
MLLELHSMDSRVLSVLTRLFLHGALEILTVVLHHVEKIRHSK